MGHAKKSIFKMRPRQIKRLETTKIKTARPGKLKRTKKTSDNTKKGFASSIGREKLGKNRWF